MTPDDANALQKAKQYNQSILDGLAPSRTVALLSALQQCMESRPRALKAGKLHVEDLSVWIKQWDSRFWEERSFIEASHAEFEQSLVQEFVLPLAKQEGIENLLISPEQMQGFILSVIEPFHNTKDLWLVTPSAQRFVLYHFVDEWHNKHSNLVPEQSSDRDEKCEAAIRQLYTDFWHSSFISDAQKRTFVQGIGDDFIEHAYRAFVNVPLKSQPLAEGDIYILHEITGLPLRNLREFGTIDLFHLERIIQRTVMAAERLQESADERGHPLTAEELEHALASEHDPVFWMPAEFHEVKQ
jgi:hypothetical protein